MKWEYLSVKEFVQAREYIDTVLVPLIAIEGGERIVDSTLATGLVLGVAAYVEDQLRGRLLLLPAFTFVTTFTDDMLTTALNVYCDQLRNDGFRNVVFLTQNQWLAERQLGITGDILKINSKENSTGDQEVKALQEDIRAEAEKVITQFIQLWNR